MAYSALLASIPDEQVNDFRDGRRSVLAAGESIRCSHILTSWVRPADLRGVLKLAIDGGESLRSDLWHPLRPPVWHPGSSVGKIAPALRKIWNEHLERFGPLDPGDWYAVEIAKVLKVFEHAAILCNGVVVSFLEPPTDEVRAKKVLIPLV